MVAEEIATLSPVVTDVLDKLILLPDVPTVNPDTTNVVPSDL
jgi:hypothetical protein